MCDGDLEHPVAVEVKRRDATLAAADVPIRVQIGLPHTERRAREEQLSGDPGGFCWRDSTVEVNLALGSWLRREEYTIRTRRTRTDGPKNTIIDGSRPTNVNRSTTVYMVSGEEAVLEGFTIRGGSGTWVENLGGFFHAGGILCRDASAVIRGNIIRDNQANNGAGIRLIRGSAVVENNLIYNNVTTPTGRGLRAAGGAIYVIDSSTNIINNTIVDNECSGSTENGTTESCAGGAVFVLSMNEVTEPLLFNNIIANNRGGNGGAVEAAWGASATIGNCCMYGNSATVSGPDAVELTCEADCVFLDPGFVSFQERDFHLRWGSPCIDAGTSQDAPAVDVEGNVRPGGLSVDIGAYEYSSKDSPLFLRGDCNDDGSVDISDAVCVLNWLFSGGAVSGCVAVTNTNGDAGADISDATYLLNHLFVGGPAPVPPYPDCGRETLPTDADTCQTPPPSCLQ